MYICTMQLSCTCAVVLMILNCMLGPDLVNICKYVAAAPVLTRGGREGRLSAVWWWGDCRLYRNVLTSLGQNSVLSDKSTNYFYK